MSSFSARPSSDIIYWPPKACPQTAKREDRGDACIYLVPRPDASSKDESEWPVQEVLCSAPPRSSQSKDDPAVYDYTITFVPRFPGDQDGRPVFLQPPNSSALEPVVYNMVIRAPASLHNHLPIPVAFDLSVRNRTRLSITILSVQGVIKSQQKLLASRDGSSLTISIACSTMFGRV